MAANNSGKKQTAPARGVTLKTLLLVCLLMLLLLLGATAAATWWVFSETRARFLLREQTGWIRFPESLDVAADINNDMQVQVDQVIPAKVPIKQAIDIPVPGDINAVVEVDTRVPVAMDVVIKDTLRVDQTIPVDTEVEVTVAGVAIDLPIKGNIPIRADIPLNLTVPVRDNVPLQFTSPVRLRLSEPLHARLDTVLDTRIPIQGTLELPVTSQIEATLNFPPKPVEAGLYYLDLSLPLDEVEFSLRKPADEQ
ncbi:MAG: hypothetical protein R3208_18530 [Ketobacteraceae bacterium]|nr:hypothetical protein [Ketobacteraceae bacterium]